MFIHRNFVLAVAGLLGLTCTALATLPADSGRSKFTEVAQNTTSDNLPDRGRSTGREIPRFVSLKARRANVRRGPGRTFPIDWVFVRQNMPVEIIDEWELWRRVRDIDGARGWIHKQLLDGRRHVMVTELAELTVLPDENTKVVALLEGGVIARLLQCELNWCQVKSDSYTGWLPKIVLWGTYDGEIFK